MAIPMNSVLDREEVEVCLQDTIQGHEPETHLRPYRRKYKAVCRQVICAVVAAACCRGAQAGDASLLSSPDGRIQVSIQILAPNLVERPHWSAAFRGKRLLAGCGLGLQIADSGDLLAGVRVVDERRRSVDERIPATFGKADHARDRFHEVRYKLETPRLRRVDVVFRCYDDAIALRYEVPASDTVAGVTITDETTSFGLTGEPTAFVQDLEHFKTSHEHPVVSTPDRKSVV